MAVDTYYTDRLAATLVEETTEGTFLQPVAGDAVIDLNAEMITPDIGTVQGMASSNGKFSVGRYYKGKQSLDTTIHTTLMEPVDSTNAGTIEQAPIFLASGFRLEDGATHKKLVYDGEASCTTLSMTAVNIGCGTGTTGAGWDIRGMRTSVEIVAEASGAPFMINATAKGCVEDYSQAKTVVSKVYANDADQRNVEFFLGGFVFDGVATAVGSITIAMNVTQKVRGDASKEGGAEVVVSTKYEPKVTITAPVGVDTAAWWQNVLDAKVIAAMVYTGTYCDITIANMSIANHSQADDEGELAMTQELSFESIEIQYK